MSLSVTDPVQMYAVRKIGKNIPFTTLTYFVDEAELWRNNNLDTEIVNVTITPYEKE